MKHFFCKIVLFVRYFFNPKNDFVIFPFSLEVRNKNIKFYIQMRIYFPENVNLITFCNKKIYI